MIIPPEDEASHYVYKLGSYDDFRSFTDEVKVCTLLLYYNHRIFNMIMGNEGRGKKYPFV